MSEQLNYQINVGGNATESIGNVKKQLKEANAELIKAQQNFGEYSNEAIAAAKKVAQLRDSIQEARETADLFDPGKKFQALSNTLSAVAGGFAAVQGAIGLFGSESKELEKQLLKVQSALALSQGLSTIADSVKDFQRLNAIVQSSTIFMRANAAANTATAATMKALGIAVDTTTTSFRVLKTAIAATGIGLAVIAIGELISAISNYTSAADKAKEAQDKLNASITKSAEGALQAEIEQINRSNDLLIAQAKLRGASEKEIFEIEQSSRKLRIEARNRFNKDVANADKEAANNNLKEIRKEQDAIKISDINFQTEQNKRKEEQNKKEEENRNKNFELLKQRNEKESAAQKVQIDAFRATLSQREQDVLRAEDELEEKKAALIRAGNLNFEIIEEQHRLKLLEINSRYDKEEEDRVKARNESESAAQKIQINSYRATLTQRQQDTLNAEDELEEKRSTLIRAGNYDFEIIEEEHRLKLIEINTKYDKEEAEKLQTKINKKKELDNLNKERELETEELNAISLEEKKFIELTKLQDEYKQKEELAIQNGENLVILRNLYKAKETEIDKKYLEEQKKLDEAALQSKINTLNEISIVLGSFATLAGEQTAISKGLTLGQIGIDTASAISSLTKNSEANPTNAVTFGASGAIQFATGLIRILANVKKAKDILFTSSKTSLPSVSPVSASLPTAPIIPTQQTQLTQLNQQSINAIGNSAIRAYVVETDITSNQKRIQAIKQRARFS